MEGAVVGCRVRKALADCDESELLFDDGSEDNIVAARTGLAIEGR